jgi:prefoldin alpha subunit
MATAISVRNEREIEPMSLSLEQLSNLKQQWEAEINEMRGQLEQLMGARNRFLSAKVTLEEFSKFPSDNEMFIPLNTSLYVHGNIVNPDKYLVELGTGYFCEKDAKEATALIDRKTALVNDSIDKIQKVDMDKRRNLNQLVEIMKYKISQAQGGQ